jgi:23S rRNA (adenine2030-N6)-methyltransferase
MNYRHAFHAGNHADVLKHVVALALLRRLQAKPGALFVLDTHAGRGLYRLDEGSEAARTGEWREGVGRLAALPADAPAPLQDYLATLRRAAPEPLSYPGSPRLLGCALREQDRLAACELQPDEASALRSALRDLPGCAAHARDGYAALTALLPPAEKRGLVLIDPPFEAQLEEFTPVQAGLKAALARWPQGHYALWYPIKQRVLLRPPMRRLATLPAKSILAIELLVRPDDSPLRLNGSGMLILNPPWQFAESMQTTLAALRDRLAEAGGSAAIHWLKEETA